MTAARPRYDVILRNGTVVDGTGRAKFKADVAISGDRVAAVEKLGDAEATRDIDVSGFVVAPGFIDVHSHDDAAVIARPEMAPKLTQGVTTVISGNCGISAAPYRRPGNPPSLLRLVFKSDEFVSATYGAYVEKIEEASPSINAAFLTGQTTLRMQVMGSDLSRAATEREIAEMRDLLCSCLEEGSFGLSTGLFYPPARAASAQEVIEIAKPLSSYGGIYVTHMRDEADGVAECLAATFHVGRAVNTPVIVSHHKCMGRRNFGRSVETLAILKSAQQFQSIAWDVYPYTAGSSILNAELVELSARTVITWCDPYPEFCGRELADVARDLGCAPMEAIEKLQPAGALYFTMDEGDVRRIMCAPGAMIGSDGLPEDKHPHPRLWGTFPRVLGRYVREQGDLSLEDAVHRMTGLSARNFGLRDRGQVDVGKYADLCVFDPDTILDTATFEQPISASRGIHYVFVNGKVALERGGTTGIRAGRVLRRGDPKGISGE